MKRWVVFLFVFLLLMLGSKEAFGATGPEGQQSTNFGGESVASQLERIDVTELKVFWEDIVENYGGYLPESQKGSFIDFINGEKKFSFEEWVKGIARFAFQELMMNGQLLGTLIMLTLFSMFLQSIQNAFESGTVSKVAYALVYMVLIILALNSFRVAMDYAMDAIDTMIHFILALIPILLALIASSGGLLSAAFFHPVLIFIMNTSGLMIKFIVLPLLFLSALLSIVSTLNAEYKVTQLANMLRNWSIGLLGAFMTIFLGVISVQGATAAVSDGITIRTAKFITGNFVPVIGRMFTDAADTVISASVLLKNTVGVVGVAILLMIVAFPAVQILMMAFIYKFSAALLQPLGGGPVIACLDIISKNIIYVFASLAIVSLMFFLCLTIIITAGNITMMVR
ncbi:stage III sporulation protein AE [Bacillus coahuilensis m2-6]|uniref:Stage III sporulation protein AE n=1 Tax=Bacillus coahuilensis p1.1.43 TaxID=1150625 RepID=A0A147K7U1_9BACI|nr:stage III sporulation protein AE [Bacillus coahuilensis]KUP06211.1 stage III sporulation protein AE [Bacillus coahuilensis p1.1.43]KUP07429.1 stage III sporulation protein AE [Bacillus coahuilensis m2-6]